MVKKASTATAKSQAKSKPKPKPQPKPQPSAAAGARPASAARKAPAKKAPARAAKRPAAPARKATTSAAAPRPRTTTVTRPGTTAAPRPSLPISPAVPNSPAAPTRPPILDGPIVVDPNVPIPTVADPIGNFFDSSRLGRAVVRPHDLVALRLELRNLTIAAGSPPRLRKTGTGAAHLIVHFPPQAITERTFWEAAKPYPAGGSEELAGPPVRARISGESRLAFTVPNGFDVPYTLEGVLAAVEDLALSVTATAKPPVAASAAVLVSDIFAKDIATLSPSQRASLTSYAARSLRIAAVQEDNTTLLLRQATGGVGVRAVPKAVLEAGPEIVVQPRPGPALSAPTATQTAIELPWRLIISPHSAERWRHAKAPVTSPAGRTELWHSRLLAPKSDGTAIEPPRADPQRTIRAIWALSGEGSTKTLQSQFPSAADLPAPSDAPFLMPMTDFDRFQIAHLSSNFSMSDYAPKPVDANLLMLSSLGGWLDSRGAWVPPGLSVEEWVHRGTMARDHYVRIVYKGFLFPFGHRVALIKVSERKFHNGARDASNKETIEQRSGNTAYLRQRIFIVIRERERRYVDPGLRNNGGTVFLHRQFPFSSVRLVTSVTPNLDPPGSPASSIDGYGNQLLFWPCVNGQPFEFQCVATDLDGRAIRFGLPLIFMDNTLAGPQKPKNGKLEPDFDTAESKAKDAYDAWHAPARSGRRVAQIKQQRVAMAPSVKAGDTSVQADEISFDAFVQAGNSYLRTYSNNLARPLFYPAVETAKVRIAALAQLTGSGKNNRVNWNAHYLQHGFENNQGQVFVNVAAEPNMAKLDFSQQGDRSGGFVQPNLTPSALSRLTGPVTGNVNNFIGGALDGADAFPTSISDLPLPLLFGCIPLGAVIEAVSNLADKPEQVPKFGSEASTQVEQFINGLVRLFEFVTQLADQPSRLGDAAVAAVKHTLDDLLEQAQSYAAPLVADVKARINQLVSALNGVAAQLQPLFDVTIDAAPALPGLAGALAAAQGAATNLRTTANASVNGVSLPSGFRQSLLQAATQIETFLADIGTITTLISQGQDLYEALYAIVGEPDKLGDLLTDPGTLADRLDAVQQAIIPLRNTVATLRLLDGAPRQTVLDAMDTVVQVLEGAEQLLDLLEMLTGDELTIRFDWKPPISNWALPGADPNTDALFRANDKRGFIVAVEAKVKKNGSSAPKISVVCSLNSFDLVLIAPASFIELNFEKIEFRIDSAAKMDVDVLLTDIKFVGPLSFVETLRDLIPLDGFSDPPFLDITPQGIDAGFSLALPNISVGVFNLSNLSLGAGFTVPFIGQPLSVRFNFCTREQPFNLTVSLFGGGGVLRHHARPARHPDPGGGVRVRRQHLDRLRRRLRRRLRDGRRLFPHGAGPPAR